MGCDIMIMTCIFTTVDMALCFPGQTYYIARAHYHPHTHVWCWCITVAMDVVYTQWYCVVSAVIIHHDWCIHVPVHSCIYVISRDGRNSQGMLSSEEILDYHDLPSVIVLSHICLFCFSAVQCW